jgi:hypothetical protein
MSRLQDKQTPSCIMIYNQCMSRSVEVTTPIPSAEKIAERLGMGAERQKMLLSIVRRGDSISVRRNSRSGQFVSKKNASRNKSDKRAKDRS